MLEESVLFFSHFIIIIVSFLSLWVNQEENERQLLQALQVNKRQNSLGMVGIRSTEGPELRAQSQAWCSAPVLWVLLV